MDASWKYVVLLLVFTLFVIIARLYSRQQTFLSFAAPAASPPYEAPLRRSRRCYIYPGQFIVYLIPGHSLPAHSKTIGIDITPYIIETFDRTYKDRIAYACKGVDDKLLASIRADLGVDHVDCESKPRKA
jgi:hypothetical protein